MQEKKIFIKNKYDNKLCEILNELSEDKCIFNDDLYLILTNIIMFM